MIPELHPIVARLHQLEDYEFVLVGSRAIRNNVSVTDRTKDWDFLVQPTALDLTGWYRDKSKLIELLSNDGFVKVEKHGYGLDNRIVHMRWKASNSHQWDSWPPIDVMIPEDRREFDHRRRVLDQIYRRHEKLRKALASDFAAWAELFELTRTARWLEEK